MRVDNCPKRLFHCANTCPIYPCWAYDEFLKGKEKSRKEKDQGWD
jgi:hypothetical protein